MHFIVSFLLVLAVVALSSAQLFGGPPRIVLDDQNQPTNTGLGSWWGGRGGFFRGGPPAGGPGGPGGPFGGPWGGPFDNVYNTKGDKLTCKMMCEPEKKADIDIISVAASEKKDETKDNKIEKKD